MSTSQFGAHFQLSFLAFMVRDSEFCAKVAKHVKPEFFTDDGFQRVVRLVLGFYHEHHAAPDTMIYHELDNLMSDGLVSKDAKAIVEAVLQECFRHELNNKEYILEQYHDFLRASRIQAAFPAFAENVEKCNFDKAEEIMRGVLAPDEQDAPRFRLVTAAEAWDMDYRIEYLVRHVLAEHQTCVIGGSFKCMKTSIGMDLSVSLASATPFLGHFSVPKRKRVLFFSAESSEKTLVGTMKRICRDRSLVQSDLGDRLIISPDIPMIDDVLDQQEVGRLIQALEIDVVIVDPLYKSISPDVQSNLAAAGQLLRAFETACTEQGATLVVCHHGRKDTHAARSMPVLGDLSGAGHAESYGQWILLAHREEYHNETGEHFMWLNVGGRSGHGGQYGLDIYEGEPREDDLRDWSTSVVTVQDAKDQSAKRKASRTSGAQDEKDTQDKFKIYQAVRQFEPVTKSDVRQKVGLGRDRFAKLWEELLDDQNIVSAGKVVGKGNGQKYEGYRTYASLWDEGDPTEGTVEVPVSDTDRSDVQELLVTCPVGS